MLSSSVTSKGQITIPADIRHKLNINPGDQVVFFQENDRVVFKRKINDITASFGLLKANKGVSLQAMERAIKENREK